MAIDLPLKSNLYYSGIELNANLFEKVRNYKLLNEIHKNAYTFHHFKTRKHCLFDYRNNKDRTFIGFEYDDSDNGTSGMPIVLEVNNEKNNIFSESLISFQVSLVKVDLPTNAQLQLFKRRATVYDSNRYQMNNFDQIIITDIQNLLASKVSFNYYILHRNEPNCKVKWTFYFFERLIRKRWSIYSYLHL